MFVCIKNADVYAPEHIGKKDILCCNDRIVRIDDSICTENLPFEVKVIDAKGKKVIPGLIDQHVHITGGGGESGFTSRVPEIRFSHIIESGVTTVVGTLGTDAVTRSVQNLVAKAKALNEEGITCYCLTGAYELPSPTITGSVKDDITYINEVIGVKLAISDHRCSSPTKQEIIRLATDARLAGLVSGKVGEVHMHTGIGLEKLDTVLDIVKTTDIPIKHFRPTHMRKSLEANVVEFTQLGGYADYTASEDPEAKAKEIMESIEAGSVPERLTLSSDSNGSTPKWNEKRELIGITYAKMTNLWNQIKALVNAGMEFEAALSLVTRNVAKALEIYPKKGCLAENSDADIVILDDNNDITHVIAKGNVFMENGKVLKKGFFED